MLRSGQLSLGPVLADFEERFAATVHSSHAVAVSSGTAALHLGLLALELPPAAEVITTPFSFIASANCALLAGGVPVFCDIDPDTWNLDPQALPEARGPRSRAVLPVHVFGQPARMDAIGRFAAEHHLAVLEDACEAIGARFQGRLAGTLGTAGAFAFYPNKQMTTAEGGMLVTEDADLATRVRALRNQGREDGGGWLAHARLGYNYRLSDLHAALGRSQLARLDDLLERRARVAEHYRRQLADCSALVLQHIRPDVCMSWFVFVVRLADDFDSTDRDRVLRELQARGIGCSNYFVPIHLQPFYRDRFGYRVGDFPICEHVAARTLALPFHANLSPEDVDEVCGELKAILGR